MAHSGSSWAKAAPPRPSQKRQGAKDGLRAGTRVWVHGHGAGTYRAFEYNRFSSSKHTIKFDTNNNTITLALSDLRWFVLVRPPTPPSFPHTHTTTATVLAWLRAGGSAVGGCPAQPSPATGGVGLAEAKLS